MKFIFYYNLLNLLLFILVWISIIIYIGLKKKKSKAYVIFFTIFYIYIVKVLDYTLLQFQSLLILRYFLPQLILNGETAAKSINLIPLATLSAQDLKTSLLNTLLLVPFGFGLPFITRFRLKKIVFAGMVFSILVEVLQLLTGLIGKTTFRITDINDVIFNRLGGLIGYMLFIGFMYGYRYITLHRNTTHPILKHISERPQDSCFIRQGKS